MDRFRRLVFCYRCLFRFFLLFVGFKFANFFFNFLMIFFFGYNVYDLLDVLRGCSLTRPFSSQIMILAFVGKLLNIYFKQ